MSALKNITLTDGFVFRIGKLDRPRGWPEGKSPAEAVSRIEWQQTESGVTVTAYTPSETEGGPDSEGVINITQDEIDALAERVPEPSLPSIWERVRAIVDQFPKSAQVKLPFEKYDYYKRAGSVEGARLVIEGYDTSGGSADIQQAQQAILAEFDKEETAQ